MLLALRRNTGYADEMWNLPSGKLDAGEHVLAAVVREAREEIGIDLDESALDLAGVLHHRSPELVGRVGLVFSTPYDPARHGVPFNAEPHKCGGIDWYPSDALPEATVPYTVACVDLVRREARLGVHGWGAEPVDTRRLGMGGSASA